MWDAHVCSTPACSRPRCATSLTRHPRRLRCASSRLGTAELGSAEAHTRKLVTVHRRVGRAERGRVVAVAVGLAKAISSPLNIVNETSTGGRDGIMNVRATSDEAPRALWGMAIVAAQRLLPNEDVRSERARTGVAGVAAPWIARLRGCRTAHRAVGFRWTELHSAYFDLEPFLGSLSPCARVDRRRASEEMCEGCMIGNRFRSTERRTR